MRLGPSGQYPLVIDRESRHSVFVVNQDRPYVEVLGLKSLPAQPALLKLRGEANVYVGNEGLYEPILSRSDQDRQNVTINMSEISASAPNWFTEASPRRSVRWSAGQLENLPPNRVDPSHFLQDGTVLSGFDERSLPQLPDVLTEAGGIDTPGEESISREMPLNPREF